MRRILSYLRDKHTLWFKLTLMSFCLFVIVLTLPNANKVEYSYEIGKPWENEDLIAPFDFAVYKSPQEVIAEQNNIREKKPLYYTENDSSFKKNIETFFAQTKLSKQEADVCRSAFNILLHQKIIQLPDSGAENPPIWIIKDKAVVEKEFSEFFTILQADNFLTDYISKNVPGTDAKRIIGPAENTLIHTLTLSKTLTEQYLNQELNDMALIKDKRLKGQSIVNKGEVVDNFKAEVINSLQKELAKQNKYNKHNIALFLGKMIYVALCLAMVFLFLGFFRTNIFAQNRQVTFIFLLVVLFVFAGSLATRNNQLSLYAVPFAIAPILIRAFFDTRTALFVHLNIILLSAVFIEQKFNFVFIEILSGIAAIFSIANLTRRSQLLITSLVVLLVNLCAYFALHAADIDNLKLSDCNQFLIASGCVLISYPLIYVFEKMFGFISDFTLLELNDTGNNALLKQLSSEAPGTFQHSLQVANMAEEAIGLIGGNALLARTGAMYHDVGKLYNTAYFIENQSLNNNPHEDLTYQESANIIIGHIIKGIELAHKHKLPEQIIDFIRTHHGTTLASYFYYKAKEENAGIITDEKKFRYPGPIPFSKETGVLMLADSVEASSRSLKSYDALSIDDLVERIFKYKMDENQLINSDLTLKELTLLKKIFKKKLMNMYHVRIEYPKAN
jgi:cyclic-di-AMP phosphodiesterase PgpH